jgi:hypothetical protein
MRALTKEDGAVGEHEYEEGVAGLDGCELDFVEAAIGDDEVETLLVAEGDEEDELDDEGAPAVPDSPDKGIATRLRRGAAILGGTRPLFKVREVDGWKTRGRDFAGTSPTFAPKGSVNHHTAGAPPSAGNAPSLGICIHGRGGPNPLSGPLCNVLQAFNDTAIVIAAGVANHAGTPKPDGRIRGMTGNFEAYGLEVEHPGTSRVADERVEVSTAIHACLLWRPRGTDIPARQVVQHREWNPIDKIDFATNFSSDEHADEFRRMVAAHLRRLNEG